MLVASVAGPVPRFKTLVAVIAASQGGDWIKQTQSFDRSRNFAESIIATTVPRRFGEDEDNPDEMQLALLHPAASRLLATLRNALESGKARSVEEVLQIARTTHEQLFGAGPLVEIRR
jgi:hypothetical protein